MHRLRIWWLCKKYGICRIHLTPMRQGGGYEPSWICDECDRLNSTKHNDRIAYLAKKREQVAKLLREKEGQ